MVPGGHVLSWFVTKGQMTTNVPAWEGVRTGMFVQNMLSDKVCGRFACESLVCLKRGGSTMVFNPQLAGDFEVQEGCDKQVLDGTRAISSACNQQTCPSRTDTSDGFNLFEGSDPTASLN